MVGHWVEWKVDSRAGNLAASTADPWAVCLVALSVATMAAWMVANSVGHSAGT